LNPIAGVHGHPLLQFDHILGRDPPASLKAVDVSANLGLDRLSPRYRECSRACDEMQPLSCHTQQPLANDLWADSQSARRLPTCPTTF
jgi:hypothetical protein